MSAGQFLVRGLLAGFIAGLATFGVAYVAGEPSVNAAIAVEESHAGQHDHHADDPAHSDMTTVSRHNQSTWGLLTATVAIGVALGGITALGSAFAMGRIGRLTPPQSTALVAAGGFVAVTLVPFLKYPASPPAVGNPETISTRTELYFALLAVAILGVVLAFVAAAMLLRRGKGAYAAAVVPVLGFVVLVGVAAALLPTVNEVGGFPADTLWFFRRASLLTSASLWAALGIVLTGLVGRLHARETAAAARRALAASL
jgi:predicted cobalt transporter CbtA